MPIIFILIFGVFFFELFASAFMSIASGGSVVYDERTMQTYGNQCYSEEFADSGKYEENILVVFLVNEERDGYYVYACVGDDLETDVKELWGNEYTALGRTVLNTVNEEYYEFSLSSNLADVMNKMTTEVTRVSSAPSGEADTSLSHLTNRSSLDMNENTVNKALVAFTEETHIPAVIVVDDMETVFGKGISFADIILVLIAVGSVALVVYVIYRNTKNYKSEKEKAKQNGQNNN